MGFELYERFVKRDGDPMDESGKDNKVIAIKNNKRVLSNKRKGNDGG